MKLTIAALTTLVATTLLSVNVEASNSSAPCIAIASPSGETVQLQESSDSEKEGGALAYLEGVVDGFKVTVLYSKQDDSVAVLINDSKTGLSTSTGYSKIMGTGKSVAKSTLRIPNPTQGISRRISVWCNDVLK